MTPNVLKLQHLIFDQIKAKTNNQISVHQLAGILHLSPSAIYKRLRGDRVLAFNELILLVRHFEISVDELLEQV